MTTQDQIIKIEEEQHVVRDRLGDLAESARRHLAYLALAEKIATSENALQQVLDAIQRRQAGTSRTSLQEKPSEDDGRS